MSISTRSMALLSITLLLTACSNEEDEPLQLHVPSPEWRDQVIYMLFIDRFDDGEPGNNDQGLGEFDPGKGSHFSGGDLQGVIDRLDYIKSLGATAVWISPPVANQWWSTPYSAAGWHGYWATDFKAVDRHFGTLDDYKQLSHELHRRDMYLIQDIVANHTGNFFAYSGDYDAKDTAKNFYLLEKDSTQPAPTQYPFNMVDRLNPEHADADVYHWTPSVIDYADRYQELNYSMGHLSDINTENPVVINTLKDSYKYWIDEVGVDAFRVDTAILVDHEFWRRFLHDEDGIYAHATRAGKQHFLTFGEVSSVSQPYEDLGEQSVNSYLGTDEKPEFNSMLGYPLYGEIKNVLAYGAPTGQLAYRLQRFMEVYKDPFVVPNFVDNHDTPRFLSAGHGAAFKQALALLFTVPGIPIIYQGTEQSMTETRQAMFSGGYQNEDGSFDSGSENYIFVQRLTGLRSSYEVFSRGNMKLLDSNPHGPGILAYRREYLGEVVIVLMNTADRSILLHEFDAGLASNQHLEQLFSEQFTGEINVGISGRLNMILPARAILVLRPQARDVAIESTNNSDFEIDLDMRSNSHVFENDFELSGSSTSGNERLKLIINGDYESATEFMSDEYGRWAITVPVRDFGEASSYLQVYAEAHNGMSEKLTYTTRVARPEMNILHVDAPNDAFGPTGAYINPQQAKSGQQREIEAVQFRAAGRNLEMTLTMKEVTDDWRPPNGFDNVAFTVFFSRGSADGRMSLPLINADMPKGLSWDFAHVAFGWGSYSYGTQGAGTHRQGSKLGVSPVVVTDKDERTISFTYEGARLDVDNWAGMHVYVTTWHVSGEGSYDDIRPEPSEWFFGGAGNDAAKIMDDVLLVLEVSDDAD